MASEAGRDDIGREAQGSGRPTDLSGQERAAAFSDEGMRRIVHGQDRDRRGDVFSDENAELEAALQGRRRLVPIGIALAALVCFGAIVWYAYSWGTGQMAGDQLPVVTADVSPEKSRPEQPGGMEVPHQDKLVLNNGESAAAPVVERLLPPPEIPQPPEPLPEVADIPTVPEPSITAPSALEAPAAPGEEAISETPAVPGSDLAESASPQSDLPESDPAVAQPAPAAGDSAPAVPVDPETGIALPLMKPESLPSGAAEVTATAEPQAVQSDDQIAALLAAPPHETASGNPTAPAGALKAGDIVLQLSSVKSESAAAREWARLQAAHPGLLGNMPLALDTAQVKGSTYYRVQTGPFPSRGAAADICGQLKTRNQDCLVKQR